MAYGTRREKASRMARGNGRTLGPEGGGPRVFCNFYNLKSTAAGVARNYSNPKERV